MISKFGGRTFDRRECFDPRSRNFPIRALVPLSAEPRSRTWACPVWLNQGREGACVGFSISQEAAAAPVRVPNITNEVARKLYLSARALDGIPDELGEGTSVLAGMKAAREAGWYTEWRWAFGETDLALAISHCGPAVLGVGWYEGMMRPDARGYIHPTGKIVGGHAILCRGYSSFRKCYRLRNSWGRAWGWDADCYVTADEMRWLLSNRGEAAIPVVRACG